MKIVKNTNHSFFTVIDNEIKAYLLGFLFGDGNIAKRWNTINIDVSFKDKYIIDLFHQLNPNLSLTERHKSNSHTIKVAITSSLLKKDLINKGVAINKTYVGMSIKNVPEEFYPHLIRGFFDADGCVQKRQYGFSWSLTCSSFEFLKQIGSYLLKRNIKVSINSITRPNKLLLFHLITYKASEIKKIYDLLYSDANYWLKRKRNIFIDNTEVIIEPKTSITP